MDLGEGPTFTLVSHPKGHDAKIDGVPPARFGHIISVGDNLSQCTRMSQPLFEGAPLATMALAGLNEAGLSCDLHALLNSSYPTFAPGKNNLLLYNLCNWALAGFDSAAAVKAALYDGSVHLWGPEAKAAGGVHFILRDATGKGLAVEFMEQTTKLYDDFNDHKHGYGVFTNEPEFPWQLANVRHYRWKQSLARPAAALPGAWYPDERFLRIYLVKSGMPPPASYQEAVQHALHVLNTITVPMGAQLGTDSGFGEGDRDHTHYAHIYDHKNRVLYWRHHSNLQLERVRLADVLSSSTPLKLSMDNDLPFFNDAAHKFQDALVGIAGSTSELLQL